MTRVALMVDTECKLCGGTGREQQRTLQSNPFPTNLLCSCVEPATIQNAGGHATLGTAGGMQATNTPPSPCSRCEGLGTIMQEHVFTDGRRIGECLRCLACGGSKVAR